MCADHQTKVHDTSIKCLARTYSAFTEQCVRYSRSSGVGGGCSVRDPLLQSMYTAHAFQICSLAAQAQGFAFRQKSASGFWWTPSLGIPFTLPTMQSIRLFFVNSFAKPAFSHVCPMPCYSVSGVCYLPVIFCSLLICPYAILFVPQSGSGINSFWILLLSPS